MGHCLRGMENSHPHDLGQSGLALAFQKTSDIGHQSFGGCLGLVPPDHQLLVFHGLNSERTAYYLQYI